MTNMMKCGHSANATSNGKPVCVICLGINDGAREVMETPNLNGRIAVCSDCRKEVPSSVSLAFFEIGNLTDWFYCGCRGWN